MWEVGFGSGGYTVPKDEIDPEATRYNRGFMDSGTLPLSLDGTGTSQYWESLSVGLSRVAQALEMDVGKIGYYR